MKIGSHFRPLTFALAAFALPFTASAQISVSGDLTPPDNDPFWTSGGNGSTNGFIGVTGVGTLTVQGSSTLTLFNGILGQQSGSVGNASVIGADAEWNNTGNLVVGAAGTGLLGVTNGALVTSSNSANIAEGIGSLGTVTVNNSTWTIAQILQVGRSGTGSLNVENGAVVTNNNSAFVGRNGGSVGTATVTGTGSLWNAGTALAVGENGNGTLTVANDGQVNADAGANQINLATVVGSTGTLNIGNGGGSGVVKTGTVQGGAGTGVLNFNHSETDYVFTDDTTSFGTAIAIAGNVDVNHLGTGTTTIVGDSTFSGNITVEDGTLVFTNGSTTTTTGTSDDFNVGSVVGKTGTVLINNGATVDTGDDLFVGDDASTGHVQVTGPGTQLGVGLGSGTSFGSARIGDDSGNGTLTVSQGATVQISRDLQIATAGAQGMVTVTGTGSTLDVANDIIIDGENGPGLLQVVDGGFVRLGGGFELGESEDESFGQLLVSGSDSFGNASRVEANDRSDIGSTGGGSMTVEAGGQFVSTANIFISNNNDTSSSVTVTGTDSLFSTMGVTQLGREGAGILTVADGGVYEVDGGSGTIQMGGGSGNGNGVLNIGAGGAAGIVNVAVVTTNTAVGNTGTLNFNHNETDYNFTNDGTASGTAVQIAGPTDVNHIGSGTTSIVGDSTFSGEITVEDGTMTFTNGSTTATTGGNDDLVIGSVAGKTGTVIINNGATVSLGADLELGSTVAGTTGDLLVTGAGTKLVVGTGSGPSPGDADIGDGGGSGTLTVSNGAEVQFNRTVDVATDGGQGRVTVTGTGSKFSAVRTITVDGENGPGRFEVLDGGFVRADSAFEIGENEDESLGQLLISGVDSFGNASRVEATTRTDLGTTGGGSITVEAGGQFVSTGNIIIHDNSGSSSSVTVTGADSLFSTVGLTELGRFGDGTLTVAESGVYEVDGGSGTIQMGGNTGNGNGVLNIGAGGAAGNVNVAVVTTNTAVGNTGTLNFNHNETDYQFTNDGTAGGTAISIEGQTSVRQIGTGTTTVSGNNSYTGGTTIEDGTLRLGSSTAAGTGTILIDGGTLDINGQTVDNAVSFGTDGGVLKGSGTVNASVVLDSTSQVLAPGDSPGITLYGANQTWESFTYLWELNDWQSQVAGTTFDQLEITGSLSLTGSAVDDYHLDITSLTALDEPGDLPNFSETTQSWIIITTTDGITGFDESYWTIFRDHFSSDPNAFGVFSLDVIGNDLVLTYTVPEPTTGALLLAGLGYMALRRRRQS